MKDWIGDGVRDTANRQQANRTRAAHHAPVSATLLRPVRLCAWVSARVARPVPRAVDEVDAVGHGGRVVAVDADVEARNGWAALGGEALPRRRDGWGQAEEVHDLLHDANACRPP